MSTRAWTAEEEAEFRDEVDPIPEWLIGNPMDPASVSPEPLPPLAGFPFLLPGKAALVSGPTGRGRSSLIQAGAYDAALLGLRCAYLGVEVTEEEFHARAAHLASVRGDEIADDLRRDLASVRYLSLPSVVNQAWRERSEWLRGARSYQLVAIDPLATVASTLGLDFDSSNRDFTLFYDELVQPLTDAGVAVVMVDNIGHGEESRNRAKGVSSKGDKADLTFSCKAIAEPPGLVVRCQKVRTIRAPFRVGDEWLFERATQRISRHQGDRPAFRPTGLMEQVSKLLESDPGLSKRSIRSSIKGRNEYIDLALELLASEGFIERTGKDGYLSRRAFREAESD